MSKQSALEQYTGVEDMNKHLRFYTGSAEYFIPQSKIPAIKFGNKRLVERAILEQFTGYFDPRSGNKATLLKA